MGLSKQAQHALLDVSALSAMFVFVQFLGTWFAYRQVAIQTASPPSSSLVVAGQVTGVGTAVLYVVLLLLMTGMILALVRFGLEGILSYVAYFIVFVTILGGMTLAGFHPLLSVAGAVGAVAVYEWHRTWYVVTTLGLLISAVAIGAFAASWSAVALVSLILLLTVYDIVAVYITGHMQKLARGAGDKLPLLVIIPHHMDVTLEDILSSDEDDDSDEDERQGAILGLGDLIIPSTLLPIASMTGDPLVTLVGIPITVPYVGAMLGTLLGVGILTVLLYYVESDGHAGLPPLNVGVLLGFFVAGGSVGGFSLLLLV